MLSAFPEDVPAGDFLAAVKGDFIFDWWVGDPRDGDIALVDRLSRCYFMRPRVTHDPREIVNTTGAGICTLLTDTGCKIKEERHRPIACREFVANPKRMDSDSESCSYPGNEEPIERKRRYIMAWVDYQDQIVDLLNQSGATED